MPLYPSKRKEKNEEPGELNITSLMDTFTIILVFLIQQYGTSAVEVADGYRPPVAEARLPADRVVTLQIREIMDGAITYRVGNAPEKAERRDAKLGYQQLRADLQLEKRLVDAAIAEEELKGAINIIGDNRMTFRTVTDVMRAAAMAGFFKLKLIAQS